MLIARTASGCHPSTLATSRGSFVQGAPRISLIPRPADEGAGSNAVGAYLGLERVMLGREPVCEVYGCRHSAAWHQFRDGDVVCMFCYMRAKRRTPSGPIPPVAYICTFVPSGTGGDSP